MSTIGPGAIVGGTRLVRPLEEGGMGAVWVGEDVATKTQVAVKFMLEEVVRNEPQAPERFNREAEVLGRVKHPHIVKMFDVGTLADGTPFIIMELLSGESIVDRLERTEQPMTIPQVTDLISQVCTALEHIHGQGIVHRDLKGENTFLLGTSDAVYVKIIDFGLAKAADLPGAPKLTVPGQQIGSPEYMSPEQVMGSSEVDHKADLWAVGVLAYIALTLSFPFQASAVAQLLMAIRAGEFEPASRSNPAIPPQVDAWFATAFQLMQSQRFASARVMADAWREAVGAPSTAAAPSSLGAPAPSAAAAPSRMPLAIAIAAGVGLLLIIGTIVALAL